MYANSADAVPGSWVLLELPWAKGKRKATPSTAEATVAKKVEAMSMEEMVAMQAAIAAKLAGGD